MLDFNRISTCYWDIWVIPNMNSRSSWDIKSGEGFLGGNHVVGCSRIYQVSLRLSEAFLQGMTPLMIFFRLSSIVLLGPCGREILFYSRSVVNWLMVIFMHWLSRWKPLIQYGHLVFSNLLFFLEPEAPSEDIWFSFGFESVFLVSFPLCFPLACALFESVTKRAWFLEV